MLDQFPDDPETWALQGRVDKDAWTGAWERTEYSPEKMREEAAYEDALLRAAVESYATAFRANPGHYYSGINALTLMHLYRHLTENTRYDALAAIMEGAVRFAAAGQPEARQDYYSKVTIGDLEVLLGTPERVTAAYKEAIARNDRDWFALNTSRRQLLLLKHLGFRPRWVEAGIATFDRALQKLKKPADQWEPRQVLLFSGHMIDAPNRPSPRFPPEKEGVVAERIAAALDDLGAGAEDLAFSQAAAGGDLLFLEACRKRGVRSRIQLPLEEPAFIEQSIAPSTGGDAWRARYFALKATLDPAAIRCMPTELGPLPRGVDPFERCNLWLLYSALARGIDKVRFVCVWNGGGGDGPGGTAHMYNEVKRRTGRATWIDIRTL